MRADAVRDVHHGRTRFVKFGDREWTPEELNALKAIASLFAQLQAASSPRTSCAFSPSMTT
jgi:hypothetical protein